MVFQSGGLVGKDFDKSMEDEKTQEDRGPAADADTAVTSPAAASLSDKQQEIKNSLRELRREADDLSERHRLVAQRKQKLVDELAAVEEEETDVVEQSAEVKRKIAALQRLLQVRIPEKVFCTKSPSGCCLARGQSII